MFYVYISKFDIILLIKRGLLTLLHPSRWDTVLHKSPLWVHFYFLLLLLLFEMALPLDLESTQCFNRSATPAPCATWYED